MAAYRSRVYASTDRRRTEPVEVRVVEYELADPALEGSERYRLATTLLDPEAAPAEQLAAAYPERWEFETALDELKTHQRGRRLVLRSKSPEGVYQEVYGHLLVHYAIRALMHEVAVDRRPRPGPIVVHAQPARRPPQRPGRPGLFPHGA